ncbi:MAG: calcium/proton exchanger [Alphaproteobacteria bacterium]|nr:calcium/proton exchanger [Alphaproteobacteria bacterium]
MANAASIRIAVPLVFVPLSLGLHHFFHVQPQWVFLSGLIAIGALADWVRRGTEEVAGHLGSVIGSLLNVSFGNAAELVLALFVLVQVQTRVVQAQISGSIIGTTLLFFGIAALVGGLTRKRQTFSRSQVEVLSTLLLLVSVAILLPAAYEMTERLSAPQEDLSQLYERLSLCISVVLLFLYAAYLVYVLVTHRVMFVGRPATGGTPEWSLPLGLAVMAGGIIGIAFESELVSERLLETAASLGLSPTFMGVVMLALIGTIADLYAAVAFARADKMDIVLGLCVGSAIQIGLVVAPVLVLASWAMGNPMTLVFADPLDLFSIASAAFIVRAVASDGETNWYEGLLLIGVYVMFALAYFFQR